MSAETPVFELDDDGVHVHVRHQCTRPEGWPPVEATLPIGDEGWTTVTADPLTVTPSVHCTECGMHGFHHRRSLERLLMQSPPLELVLDVAHLATRNLLRNTGDPDDDTISEIIRHQVHRHPLGPAAFTVGIYLATEGFRRHILKGHRLNPWR